MTLIQRQEIMVRVLTKILARKWPNPGLKSRAFRKVMEFNERRMVFAGYSKAEAKESFKQCEDVARLSMRDDGPLFAVVAA